MTERSRLSIAAELLLWGLALTLAVMATGCAKQPQQPFEWPPTDQTITIEVPASQDVATTPTEPQIAASKDAPVAPVASKPRDTAAFTPEPSCSGGSCSSCGDRPRLFRRFR